MKTFSGAFAIGLFLILYSTLTFSMCLRSKDISGGEDHTMVLTEADTVFACGRNNFVQIGNSSVGSSTTKLVSVEDGEMSTSTDLLEDIAKIAAGWTHSLALDEDGFTWSWGGNSYGQLGLTEKKIVLATEYSEIAEILTTDYADYTDFNEYSKMKILLQFKMEFEIIISGYQEQIFAGQIGKQGRE